MADKSNELIVLRRIVQEPEKKKGGVWKIAHADFMTAMMAFFLIMWLVNATDEELKKSIANYFNPLNLVQAPTDKRGIQEPDEENRPPSSGDEAGREAGTRPLGANSPGDQGARPGGGTVEEGDDRRMDSVGALEETDGAVFHDPYAVMASTASDIDPDTPVAIDVPESTLGTQGTTSRSETERDPFDPAYWQVTPTRPAQTLRPGTPDTVDAPQPGDTIDAAAPPRTGTSDMAATVAAPAITAGSLRDADGREAAALNDIGPQSDIASQILLEEAAQRQAGTAAEVEAALTEAEKAARQRQDAVDTAAGAIRDALAGVTAEVDVTTQPDAVLISLTDDDAFSMFAIGSAEPSSEAVDLFSRVAGALSGRDGTIVVRGHTDARPFRSGVSDNWVLSFARAHAAKQALTESGIDETRIARVEGLADREPKRDDDPFADENRRIEILYEPTGEAP